jgi:hypothetical protein
MIPTDQANPLRSLDGWLAGARFFAALPFHLARPLTRADARQRIQRDLASRADRLIDRLRHDVFHHPASPYLPLFHRAGISFDDAASRIRRDGPEAALHHFHQSGISLSVQEFKAAVTALRSPRAAYHLRASSGASRSSGTPILLDLAFIRACAADCLTALSHWGDSNWVKADYETPGAGARFRLTKFAMFGRPPAAWFSQVDPADPAYPPILRWNTEALRWSSRLAARTLPRPVFAPLDDPLPVARWLAQALARGRTPVLFTFPGSAVQVALAARRHNLDIAGARFLISGEPITAARLATIRAAGAVPLPRYGSMETGAIGYGCTNPKSPDDVHLLSHRLAVIQDNGALFITALDPRSPFLLLNVSMGDHARLERRPCGCPWEALGLDTHLSHIRSHEKLTGGGVTFLGAEVIDLLERVLPEATGGAPTDFQLAEAEGPSGEPLLRLRVHPRLGPVDEARLAAIFLDGLAASSTAAAVMVRMWRDAGTVSVVREAPAQSRAGKILHLAVTC